jgi:hypothetical protein
MNQKSAYSNARSSSGDALLGRVMSAAATHAWDLGPGPAGTIMATRDSGTIGQPWVVLAARAGRGLRISLYRPGDAIDVDGDVIDEVAGNPREMGRQLRLILEELPTE